MTPLLLLLCALVLLPTTRSSITGLDRFAIRGLPIGSDPWCQSNCASLAHCSYMFGADKVDLQMKVDSSVLDGPGGHLIEGVFLGDTIGERTQTL